MAATSETANFKLPIYEPDDTTSWLTDFNGAMEKIDESLQTLTDNIASGGGDWAELPLVPDQTIASSISNISSYQAARAKIRYKKDGNSLILQIIGFTNVAHATTDTTTYITYQPVTLPFNIQRYFTDDGSYSIGGVPVIHGSTSQGLYSSAYSYITIPPEGTNTLQLYSYFRSKDASGPTGNSEGVRYNNTIILELTETNN